MYQELRSSGKFSYETINTKMANHQAMWPEAIWNEDAYNKYLDPYLTKNENYLDMLQGDKKSQRDWWLFNTFRYRDSKYQCGDAQSNFITLRCYDTNSITVTPYSNIWPRIKFGSSTVTCRGKRNESYTFECPLDQMNDTECYIYSADRIAHIGDLSPLNVGLANFSMATKLQNIILGSSTEGYQNTQLTDLNVGNNELLTLLNVENCIKLTKPVDMSGCHGLETVLAKGTALTGINLPNGGHLKTLELPATIANLKIQNQKNIEKLSLEGQDALTTLYIENTPNLDLENLINNSPNLNRVRLIGIEWNATSEDTLRTSIEILKKCSGLDATGQTVSKAVLSGRVHVPSITNEFLEEINDIFPELVVVVSGVAKFFVKFLNYDNTLLYRYICEEGQEITDPIEAGIIEQPTRENTATGQFTWLGWSEQLPITAANKAYNIIAKFYSIYLVQFVNDTGESVYETWVEEGKNVEDPVATGRISAPTREQTVQYKYEFKGWDKPLTEIMAATIFKPTFNEVLRSYEVFFYVDNRELQKTLVLYGDTAQYQGDVSLIKKIINGEESPYFEFQGWSPDPSEPITGSKYYYAQFAFNGYIEDDWATIAANCATGNIDAYGYGGRKKMTLTIGDETEELEFEIVGKNHDTLATVSDSYNNGEKTAGLSFLVYAIPNNTYSFNYHVMNRDRKKDPDTGDECLNAGGWRISDLREYLNSTLYAALSAELKSVIKPVVKKSDGGYFSPKLYTSTDKLWIPSCRELNGEISSLVTAGQGEPYAMFTNANSRIKGKKSYWTRSSGIQGQNYFSYIDNNGLVSTNAGASASRYLAWGFCI